jgi:hypothetical protein
MPEQVAVLDTNHTDPCFHDGSFHMPVGNLQGYTVSARLTEEGDCVEMEYPGLFDVEQSKKVLVCATAVWERSENFSSLTSPLSDVVCYLGARAVIPHVSSLDVKRVCVILYAETNRK